MRVFGILGVTLLAFKAIYAGPHWPREGVPHGKNTTVRTIATVGTVYVPCETTSTLPGTISPHLKHTSLVSPLSTAKTIFEAYNTPLKSPFSKKSWYGYNTTIVGSMSGTRPSYGTGSIYVTPPRSLSGYNTTSTFVSGTRPSYGTHGPYIPSYKTSPRYNSTSSIVGGTSPGYGTPGTCVTPYKTSPTHNSTSNIGSVTRSSYGIPSIYPTSSKGSPIYSNISSNPSVTARPSHGPFVSPSFTFSKNITSYGSVKNTITPSYGTSIGSSDVTTIITTIHGGTPSRGFPSTVTTTVFLTGSSIVSTPEPSSPPVTNTSTIPVTSPSVTTVTLRLTGSNGVISTTFTSMTLIPPPISISSVVITIISTIPFVSSTPTVVPPPSESTGTSAVSQTPLTPVVTTIVSTIATVVPPLASGVPIVTIETQYSSSTLVGPPPPPPTETSGTTTESKLFSSKAPSSPPPASPTSTLVSVPSPLITTISTPPTSSSIGAPLSPPSPITTPASNSASQCCFVVQDTVDYNYWTDISTSTVYSATSLTLLVTHVSSYFDTAVTSVQTSYLPYTASTSFEYNNAEQPAQNTNNAPGGPTTVSSGLGGTATVTYAQTINSPDPFFLYRTAKIILVPAVTEPNGQLACGTTSTFYPSTFNPSIPNSVLFTGINSNAEQYYSSGTATASATVAAEISLSTPFVLPLGSVPAAYTSLTLPTPAVSDFINTKRKIPRAMSTSSSLALNGSVSEYGYVPDFFIGFLAQDPNYVAQFPQLASCFPGGPSIDPGFKTSAIVQAPILLSNLVSSTTSTAHPSGCFNPDSPLCLIAPSPPPPSITPLAVNAPPSFPSPQAPSNPQPPPPSSPPSPPPSSPSPPLPSSPVAPSPPAPPAYNPNNLSPPQLASLLSALQSPASPSTPPTPPVSAPPQPPATQALPASTPAPPSSPPSPVIPGSSSPPPPPPVPPGPRSSPPAPVIPPGPVSSPPAPVIPPGPVSSPASQVIPGSSPSPSSPPNSPGPVGSPVSQVIPGSSLPQSPPATSLHTSLSPAINAGVSPTVSSTTTSEPAPTRSIEHSNGGPSRLGKKPLWSLWSVSLGCFILTIF